MVMDFRDQVWKQVWEIRFLVWNRVRKWRTWQLATPPKISRSPSQALSLSYRSPFLQTKQNYPSSFFIFRFVRSWCFSNGRQRLPCFLLQCPILEHVFPVIVVVCHHLRFSFFFPFPVIYALQFLQFTVLLMLMIVSYTGSFSTAKAWENDLTDSLSIRVSCRSWLEIINGP